MEQTHVKKRRRRRKVCSLCVGHYIALDYKNLERVKRFLTDRGKIVPRRSSGACAKHQRIIASAIKRARFMGLIPHCID